MADRISSLPDEILSHILSFLLMKDAVATSIISHRWRNLWKSLKTFKFDLVNADPFDKLGVRSPKTIYNPSSFFLFKRRPSNVEVSQSYAKWVNWVLKQLEHSQNNNLDEFGICFHFDGNTRHYDLRRWISFALKRKVRILNIDSLISQSWERGIFSIGLVEGKASSLTELRLSRFEVHSYPYPYPFGHFTSLTALTLSNVILTDEAAEAAWSTCPLLEHLCIEAAYKLVNLKLVGSSSLSLKRLELYYCHCLKNVEIDAPNLESFTYAQGMDEANFAFKSVPKLVSCCLDSNRALSGLDPVRTQMERLVLAPSNDDLENMARNPGRLNCPMFTSLKVLVLSVSDSLDSIKYIGFRCFLEACPVMAKLQVHIGHNPRTRSRINEAFTSRPRPHQHLMSRPPPHQHLKEIEVTGFLGSSYDISLVEYLTKTAVSLEKLRIIVTHQKLRGRTSIQVQDFNDIKEQVQNAREVAMQLCRELQLPATTQVLIL